MALSRGKPSRSEAVLVTFIDVLLVRAAFGKYHKFSSA